MSQNARKWFRNAQKLSQNAMKWSRNSGKWLRNIRSSVMPLFPVYIYDVS